MRLFLVIFKYLLLVILCLCLVIPPCESSDVLCLSGENQPKQRRRNESFTNRAVAEAAQARAYLSPTVFVGTLKSVLVQRDGTVRAWFAIENLLKMPDIGSDDRKRTARMANYTRLYERNRYTRDYVTTTVPAVRPKNNSNVPNNWSGVPFVRTKKYSHLPSVPETRPNLSRLSNVPGKRPNNWSGIPKVRTKNYSHLSSVPEMRPNLSRLRSVPLARTKVLDSSVPTLRTHSYSAVKTIPLTINTLNWTVSDPPLTLGPFKRTTRTLSKRPEDIEVVYYTHGKCVLEVNQDNLLLGRQYVVFGVPSDRQTWPSLTASALPIPNDNRMIRAVKKVLCNGCAKPPLIEGLQSVKVEEGGKARLRCHLAGNPIPWVEWFKDDKQITTRGRIRVKTKRRTSRLVIRRVRASDRGVYQCRAGNVVQKDPVSASASLIVTLKSRRKTTLPPPPTTTPLSTTSSTQSSPWTTEPCREVNFCNNGGTCVFYRDVQEYVCHCADGYVGLRCDYKDVRVSVGEVKNLESSHKRLVFSIVILFLVFFCLNWMCVGCCWLCCFRNQQSDSWRKFREMAPLRNLFGRNCCQRQDRVPVNVVLELSSSHGDAHEEKMHLNSSPTVL